MIEMMIARLGLDSSNGAYVLVLREKEGTRVLPIWIGQAEAESIVIQIHGLKRARPLTHDLCRSLIVGMGGTLRRVQITRVENNTYYAELHLQRTEGVVRVDARPSDAIAIALRLDAPVFAAESLLSEIDIEEVEEDGEEGAEAEEGTPFPGSPAAGSAEGAELTAEELKEYLEQLRPEDFGKFNP